ncbi:MAG: glycosyl hydrolase family 28-related protein [Longimicrobiaceae bacterium]
MIRRNALKAGLEALLALLPLPGAAAAKAGGFAPQAGGAVLNVKDFGAVGDDRADDHPAIARALDAARKAGEYGGGAQGSIVFFPPGIYRLSRPLDCTQRQFNLVGSGAYQTVLRGATRGSGEAVIDFTGAGFSTVRDLLVDVVTDANGNPAPRASTVGILIARAAGGASVSGVNLQNVVVRLKSDPGANGGNGTVALYNFGAEEANYHNVYLRGDCGLMVTSENAAGSGGYGLRSLYRPILQGSASNTAINVTGLSSLIGIAGPALRLNGGAAMQVDAFLSTHAALPQGEFPSVRRYPYAIHSRSSWIDFRHSGSMESFEGLLHVDGAPMLGLRLYTYMGRSATHPAILLSGNATLQGGDLDVTPNAAVVERVSYLIDDDSTRGPARYLRGCHVKLRNQRIRLRAPGSAVVANVIQSETPLEATLASLSAPTPLAGNVITAVDGVQVNGVNLSPSRGWGAATGTASRAPFDTRTATTRDVAERLKALIDDLAAKGLLGG